MRASSLNYRDLMVLISSRARKLDIAGSAGGVAQAPDEAPAVGAKLNRMLRLLSEEALVHVPDHLRGRFVWCTIDELDHFFDAGWVAHRRPAGLTAACAMSSPLRPSGGAHPTEPRARASGRLCVVLS